MIFQSNLRYEPMSAKLKELKMGVWTIEHDSTPQYSYFDPAKAPAGAVSTPGTPKSKAPADTNKNSA